VLPIFEVALVDAAAGEKVDDVHEKLFIGVFDFGDDGDFLTVGASFEQDLGGILGIVWLQVCHHVLAYGIGCGPSIRRHHLIKNR
jgi:hypothetical protein